MTNYLVMNNWENSSSSPSSEPTYPLVNQTKKVVPKPLCQTMYALILSYEYNMFAVIKIRNLCGNRGKHN